MDYSVLMFVLLVITGAIWAYDFWVSAPRRREKDREAAGNEPVVVEYAKAFFPVILIVFVLRSFLVEPFHIPSGSMMPGLVAGDFILVKKYEYGIRLPVINKKIIDLGAPARGDVVVFRFPDDPSVNYIKRAIGLPGDRVVYSNKTLYINGKRIEQYGAIPEMMRGGDNLPTQMRRLTEKLDGGEYSIYIDPNSGQEQTLEFNVPENSYFVMGDNRDHSNDSRYWDFVPDENLVGKAFFIWLSWNETSNEGWFWNRIHWSRVGKSIS